MSWKRSAAELWTARAAGAAVDEVDRLRQVLDPSDRAGVKNTYLDCYLKHYLVSHLDPRPSDVVLEVGCGAGRLVEFIAPRVARVFGTDMVPEFIAACRALPNKAPNSHYHLSPDELGALDDAGIGKLYVVWVLMCLRDDEAVVELLRRHRPQMRPHAAAVVIEQVKVEPEDEHSRAGFYCRYRTVEGYTELFRRAGFEVRGYTLMAERRSGPLYGGLSLVYRLLPRRLAGLGARLFAADHVLSERGWIGEAGVRGRAPTDVVFDLRVP